ncbi:MAG: carbon storage regulator [Planctomycetia bacterium]|nr:carbon storage regulator [Planctomycetia bacterium]
MLVLSRKVGEKILIGENVVITVVRITQGTVRIGVDAPRDMAVIRKEVVVPVEEEANKMSSAILSSKTSPSLPAS